MPGIIPDIGFVTDLRKDIVMLCDDCKKKEACVHIVQLTREGSSEMNLCKSCAAKYSRAMAGLDDRDYSVSDFLRGVIQNMQEGSPNEEKAEREAEASSLVCPNCGMSYHDFRQMGKIGCSVCYETFRQALKPLLRRIHGTMVHRGKIPHRTGGALEIKQQIRLLRVRQKEAVASEAYEQAAECRDKIRELEARLAAEEAGGAETGDGAGKGKGEA